jgi:hypothetical protein
MAESKSRLSRVDAAVFAAYGLATLIFTYPLPLRLASAARDWGDPFLVSWIMGWQLDKWASFDLSGYFDANVFYPHLDTLAYSEFFVPQALITAPVYYLSGNALLAHNVAMLLALATSGWCAYLLVEYVTGSRVAGFIGGLVFAFNPFMFAHLSHLQVVSAAGIPLAFLWLHRYFDSGEPRYMCFFSLTYVAQCLGNAYYAVYLTYAAGAFIAYRAVADRRLLQPRLWGHMAAHGVVSVALLAPFYLQYVRLQSTMGFSRNLGHVGGWPFLAAPEINRIYGPLTADLALPEARLFPGVVAALLALAGIVWLLWERAPGRRADVAEIGYRALGWLAFGVAALIVGIATTGGFRGRVLGVSFSATSLTNPAIILVLCLVARLFMRRRYESARALARGALDSEVFYIGLLVAAAMLSLGAPGPYRLLHAWVPGFDAIRAVPRIHILTMLAAAVLAGVALQRLRAHAGWSARPALVGVIVVLICSEYLSVPIPLYDPGPPPEVDQWLAQQPGDFAVAYYPIMRLREPWRMYRSLEHGKKMVNGFSGYPAPVYVALRERQFDFERSAEDLADLGVRYVVIDQSYYRQEGIPLRRQFRDLRGELRRVAQLGDHFVYELTAPWLTREQFHERRAARAAEVRPIDRSGWTVQVSDGADDADLVLDGATVTRWRTRPQRVGSSIVVDTGALRRLAGVSMALGRWTEEIPGGLLVEVSDDGAEWRTVWLELDYELPAVAFLDPLDVRLQARFAATDARYVRVSVAQPREGRGWTIAELDLLEPAS